MLINNIKNGDRVEIKLKRETVVTKPYVSQVEGVKDKDVLMHVPISYGQSVMLSKNEVYTLYFFTDKGILGFDAVVADFQRDDGFSFVQFSLSSGGEKLQRREFFRFTCILPIKISEVAEAPDTLDEPVLNEGVVKDLGGGGIRFVSNLELHEGCKIKSHIPLGEDVVILLGKILQKQFFPKSYYKYQYRVEFIGVLPAEQEKIVQYIFTEQRRNLSQPRV